MQISFLHSITKEGISTIFDSLGAVAESLAPLTAKQLPFKCGNLILLKHTYGDSAHWNKQSKNW